MNAHFHVLNKSIIAKHSLTTFIFQDEKEMKAVCSDKHPNNPKNPSQQQRRQLINYEMIPAKFTYFLTDGFYGSINPFMNIFYLSLGLTASQAGAITGISFVVAFIAVPLWGMLADATGYRKLIYLILCIGTGSTVFSMPFIARAFTTSNETCIPIYLNITSNTTVNMTSQIECFPRIQMSPNAIYVLAMMNIVGYTFFPSLACYIHGLVMNVVNTRERKTNYGPQKVFSSIGYAFFNLCSGLLVDHYSPEGMSKYTAAFFVFLGCILFITPSGYYLVGQGKWTKKEPQREDKTPITYLLISVFKKLDSCLFLVTVAITGIANNIFQCFVFMLMEDTMHPSETLKTLTITTCVVAELIVFPLSSRIIKLVGGPIPAMAIGTFSFLPRFLLMSWVRNPWLMMPLQLFHGLGLSLAWAAEMDYAYRIFPNEIKLTAITIVSSIYFVASGAISNIVGGIVYNNYGGVVLFQGTAVFCGLWAVFMTFYYGTKHQLSKKKARLNPTQNVSEDFQVYAGARTNEVCSVASDNKCEV